MAASLAPFRPVVVRACAGAGPRKSDAHGRKSQSPNWWTPLFGWSSDPDYIDSENATKSSSGPKAVVDKGESKSGLDPETKPVRSRFARGCFTEEKARHLRMMTTGTESFHDIMYHSAIASRLASDFSNRFDP
ncbi:uncharacterized protein LOC127794613 [Diospyros lotus]|uniref:uncharacterized protein LOC127794613 n=1 Tax=Diospyros lotus TaxID=55363 RepID=UPI00224F4A95|nr:uncharacterized protein LOC127794613 [Diospyros lotus]